MTDGDHPGPAGAEGTARSRSADDGRDPGSVVIGVGELQTLIDRLRDAGFTVIGPTRRGGSIVLAEVAGVDDLPRGWGDEQEAARFRLSQRDDAALFGFAATAQSWKSILFPAREPLWSARRSDDGFTISGTASDVPAYALLGVRSCDLHAIAIQDRILLRRSFTDPAYASRREGAFIVAVGCSHPGGTCFCVSMGTGPRPDTGFDLSLTEVLDDDGHRFVVSVGSERGASLLRGLGTTASPRDRAASDEVLASAASRMGRSMDTDGIRDLLYDNADHPRWEDVGSRCLACTNCTLVCPTCFCVSMEDITDLAGGRLDRNRVWESCFTSEHSYLNGGSVRGSIPSRYRQWMTHKLASWIDQFGESGCVGCGRCITWCPAAIDITEEAAALRVPPPARARRAAGKEKP